MPMNPRLPRLQSYPAPDDYQRIAQAAQLTRRTISQFMLFAAVRAAEEVLRAARDAELLEEQRRYNLPGGIHYQQNLVLRALAHGCGTLEDVVTHTGLEKHAALSSLNELEQQGRIHSVAGKRGRTTIWQMGADE